MIEKIRSAQNVRDVSFLVVKTAEEAEELGNNGTEGGRGVVTMA